MQSEQATEIDYGDNTMKQHLAHVARWNRYLFAICVVVGLILGRSPLPGRAQSLSPQAALTRLMTAPQLQAAWFAPAFLTQVSLAQLEQGRAAIEAMLGPFQHASIQPGGSFLLVFRRGVVRTQVALDGQGRISALGFGAPKPQANRVDVGGYHLYLQCLGTGSPTVLLEAGLDSPSEVWSLVQPEVARFTRVCAYDRAGLGGSDAGPRPSTSMTIAAALHTLLRRAGIAGPYVLVGHSIGGFHVRVYAHRYPGEVVGMVLVDASHPDQLSRDLAALPPTRPGEDPALTAIRADLTNVQPDPEEGFAWVPSAAQVRASGALGALPLVVLTRGHSPLPSSVPAGVAARLEGVWRTLQDELAGLSTRSEHVLAQQSGHFIQQDQPGLVVGAIRQVVDAARRHAGPAPCARTFPALGGTCLSVHTR
jgi:pimeloyl-ACP methyl ester carboxylesterase